MLVGCGVISDGCILSFIWLLGCETVNTLLIGFCWSDVVDVVLVDEGCIGFEVGLGDVSDDDGVLEDDVDAGLSGVDDDDGVLDVVDVEEAEGAWDIFIVACTAVELCVVSYVL